MAPAFGEIQEVYLVDDKIHFKYTPFHSVGFNKHFFAYSVVKHDGEGPTIEHSELASRNPCLSCEIDGVTYIATRHIL